MINRYASADFLGNTIYGHAISEGHHIEIFTSSSSGSRLVSTDLETGERFESPIALSTGQRALLGVANNRAAAISYVDFAGNDGIIRVFDTRTGEELHVIRRSDLVSPGDNATIVSGIVSGNSLYALTWAVETDPDVAAVPGNLHRIDLATGAVGFKTPVAVSRNDNQHPAGRGNTYNLAAGDGLIAVAGRDEVTLVDSLSGEVVSVISGLGRTVANEPVSGLSSASRYVGGLSIGGGRLFVQSVVAPQAASSPGIRAFNFAGEPTLEIRNPYADAGDLRPNDFGGSLEYRDGRLFAGQRVWVEGDRIENGDVWEYQLSLPESGGAGNGTLVYFPEIAASVTENENLNVELRLSEPRNETVSVTVGSFVSPAAEAATAGADFEPVDVTLEFLPGQLTASFEVAIIDDLTVEPDEKFLLRITGADGVDIGDSSIEMEVTIVSDDYDHTADLIPLATLDAGTRIAGAPARPVANANHFLLPYPDNGRVLFYDAETFEFSDNLVSPGGTLGRFGAAIGLEGDVAAIGAPNENSNNGRVYLVDIGGSGISQTLENPDPANLKRFGTRVALEGGFLAIAATVGLDGPRRILIYELVESTWTYAREIFSPFPTMNWAPNIALSGGELLVPRESGQGGFDPPPATFFEALFQVYDPATGSLLRTYDPVPYRTGNSTLDAGAGRYAVSDTEGVKIRQQSDNSVLFATSEYMPYAPDVAFNGRTALWSFANVPLVFYHDLDLNRTRATRFLPGTIPVLPSSENPVGYLRQSTPFARSGNISTITFQIPEFLGLLEMDANEDHLVVSHDRTNAYPTVFQLPRQRGVFVTGVSENENAGTVEVPFVLSSPSASDVRIRWSTIDGTALAGADYTAASGTVVIPAGSTSATIEIDLTDNASRDGDRNFLVQVISVQGASIIDGTARVLILDDETDLDLPVVSLAGSSVLEGDSGFATPRFGTVVFSIDTVQARDVHFRFTAESGTAFFMEDFTTPLAETVVASPRSFRSPSYGGTIPAGSLTYSARVPINGDTVLEGPEDFGITIIGVKNGRLPMERTAFVNIADDDRVPFEFRDPNLSGDTAQRGSAVALNGNLLFSGAPGTGFVEVWDITQGTFVKLTPNITGQYGAAVASSGDYLAAGAWFNGNNPNRFGLTRLMDLSGNLLHELRPSPINNNGYSGYSLVFAEDSEGVAHLLVGSPGDNANGTNTGSVTVFNATTGAQVRKIISPSATASHRFGEALAVSGATALVGTQGETAYLVNWITGTVLHTLTAGESATLFGRSVAIEGDLAIVGASREASSGADKGKVFGYNSITGEPVFTLRATDIDAPSLSTLSWAFGRAVAIQGDRIIVGAPRDPTKGLNSGSVYLFDRATRALVEKTYPPSDFNSQYFGQSLAADNSNVAIGAPIRRTVNSSSISGSTFLLDIAPALGSFSGAFDLWAGGQPFTPDPSGGAGFLPGTDLDASLAFALGLQPDATPALANARLPKAVIDGDQRYFEFTLAENPTPETTLVVEESENLSGWTPVAWRTPNGSWQGPRRVVRENADPGTTRVRVPTPAGSTKAFQRIRLVTPE